MLVAIQFNKRNPSPAGDFLVVYLAAFDQVPNGSLLSRTRRIFCGHSLTVASHFWGRTPCDDDPCGINCLLCRSIFPLGVMAAFCSGVSLSVSTKPTAVKLFTQASTCRLASVGPTPRSSAEHSTISPVAGWIKRTFGVAHALRNRARMRTKRGMFSHSTPATRLLCRTTKTSFFAKIGTTPLTSQFLRREMHLQLCLRRVHAEACRIGRS